MVMNRAMKDSRVEWIGKVPEEWDVQRLKNILIERKENNKPQKTDNILSLMKDRGVIPYSEKGDIGNKSKTDLTQYKLAYPGDIVLNSMNVIIGSVGLSKYFGAVSPVYYMLRPRLSKDFVEYYNFIFQTEVFQKSLIGYGNGIMEHRMRIPMNNLNNVSLPVPPSYEQKKIAAFLDEKVSHIDKIIEDTKKSIENLKAYKQSLITETITKGLDPTVEMKDSGIDWIGKIPKHWISSRIKYVTNISRGQFSHRPRNDERYYDGQYPFIQTGDVARAKKYITTYSQTLNELGKSVSKEFPKGTLVMNIAANVGDVAILDFDSYFPDSVVGFVPKEKYHWNYLYYTFAGMKSMFVRTAISNTQLNLNVDRIKDMHVPVTTDYNEQLKISEFLDKKVSNIDSLLEKKGEVVTELESYKKALIYEYVTGKKEVK